MANPLGKRLIMIIALAWPFSAAPQSVAVYGNWCGPNYPRDSAQAGPPVDALDAACMRHDICTASQGRFQCGCDLAFMTELRRTRWPTPDLQAKARGIYDAIAVIPCTDPFGTAQKQSLFMQDAIGDALRGNPAPFDILNRWQKMLGHTKIGD